MRQKQGLSPIWELEADLLVSVSQMTLSVGATKNHIQFYISKYLKL